MGVMNTKNGEVKGEISGEINDEEIGLSGGPPPVYIRVEYDPHERGWKLKGLDIDVTHNAKLRATNHAREEAKKLMQEGKRAVIDVINKDGIVAFRWFYPRFSGREMGEDMINLPDPLSS